jgi:hypothetical protein
MTLAFFRELQSGDNNAINLLDGAAGPKDEYCTMFRHL